MVEEMEQKQIMKNNSFGTRVGELDKSGLLTEEEFNKLTNPSINLNEELGTNILLDCYHNIIDRLKYYCDIPKDYYSIVSLWIIGTYFHNEFPSFPFLFFNAMRGSGKSRILNLISNLARNGSMLNSVTEAVLFRETGTICIDEYEGITRKGNEGLRELLNSAYKKGSFVKRMKKVKTPDGENQVVEMFELYRPVAMANIWGMEDVLGDRCISLILEKSGNKGITKIIEMYEFDEIIQKTKKMLIQCRLCRDVSVRNVYMEWNNVIKSVYDVTNNVTNIINIPNVTNVTNGNIFYEKILESGINGRSLEIFFPLLILAEEIDKMSKENNLETKIFDTVLQTMKNIISEKKEEDVEENKDVQIYDFFSQELEDNKFQKLQILLEKFKKFSGSEEDYCNIKWFGRRLKTLNLIKEKKKLSDGRYIVPDCKKAREKMEMFR